MEAGNGEGALRTLEADEKASLRGRGIQKDIGMTERLVIAGCQDCRAEAARAAFCLSMRPQGQAMPAVLEVGGLLQQLEPGGRHLLERDDVAAERPQEIDPLMAFASESDIPRSESHVPENPTHPPPAGLP